LAAIQGLPAARAGGRDQPGPETGRQAKSRRTQAGHTQSRASLHARRPTERGAPERPPALVEGEHPAVGRDLPAQGGLGPQQGVAIQESGCLLLHLLDQDGIEQALHLEVGHAVLAQAV